MSTMSSSNTPSRNIDNLNKRVDSDRIFSTALRALTSGNDPLNSSEIALLQNMYDDNDMIMTVALDFYNSNNDMDELLDTLPLLFVLRSVWLFMFNGNERCPLFIFREIQVEFIPAHNNTTLLFFSKFIYHLLTKLKQ